MLNKDLTPFMQNNSGSEQAKERLCCQGVRLMVCMSDENADVTDVITSNRKFDVSLDGHFCLTQRMNALFWLMLYELAESVHWKRENTNFRLLPVLQCTRCLRSLIINETREFLQRTFFTVSLRIPQAHIPLKCHKLLQHLYDENLPQD